MVLARIEIEHMRHGGAENGHLPVTYGDFVAYGIHRHAIGPAIRELASLGFIEITQRGRAGNREFRSPSVYRLTYRHAKHAPGDGTHEWRWIQSMEHAEEIAKRARSNTDETNISVVRRKRIEEERKSKTPVMENAKFQCRKPSPTATRSRWRKPVTTTPVMDIGTTIDISGEPGLFLGPKAESLAQRNVKPSLARRPEAYSLPPKAPPSPETPW
jgi:hypothetical protein